MGKSKANPRPKLAPVAIRGSADPIAVYTNAVLKNVTLSAEDTAIERAREVARSRRTTLNEAFRNWLDTYGNGGSPSKAEEFRALMKRLRYVDAGRKFTREEMNER